MKRILKKWLAMTLAVLMVMGTLPTTAWAARMETDEVMETPVLDKDDPVADTQGRQDEEERPEPDPDDPDPLPVDPTWNNVSISATIDAEGTWTATVQLAGLSASTPDPQAWGVLFVPAYQVRGYDHPNTVDVSAGKDIGTYDVLKSLFTDKGYTNDTLYGINGTGISAPGITYEPTDGTFVLTGTLPDLATVRTSVNSLDLVNKPTGPIDFRVLFLSKGSTGDSTHVVSTQAKYRTVGLDDATYVLNLNGPTVSRMDGSTLVADGTYNADNGRLTLPIHNTSTATVYATRDTNNVKAKEKISISTKIASNDDFATTDTTTDYIFPNGGTANFNITLHTPAAGSTMVIDVPYYDQNFDDLPANSDPLGTAKITVLVIDGGYMATPIEFRVKEGYDPSDPTTMNGESAQKDIVVTPVDATNTYVGLVGAVANTAGTSVLTPTITDSGTYIGFDYSANAELTISRRFRRLFVNLNGGTGKTAAPKATLKAGLKANQSPYRATIELSGLTALKNATTLQSGTVNVHIPVTVYVDPAETTTNNFALAYDANGGSGTIGNTMGSSAGTSTPLKAAAGTGFTRAGYTFAGWNSDKTAATAGTVEYAAGANVTVSTSDENKSGVYTKTLYAVWTQITHTVTYNFGTVTESGSSTAMAPWAVGGSAAISLPTQGAVAETGTFTVAPAATYLTKGTTYTNGKDGLGYTFNGWSDGKKDYDPGDTYTMGTSNVTLTAQWTPKNYTVTYNEGAIDAANVTLPTGNPFAVQHGASHTVEGSPLKASVTDWKFKNWQDSVTSAAAGTTIANITADHTLTAQWQVKVSYALDGGTLSGYPADHWVDYNTADASFPGNPTKSGHTFTEWQDGDGNTVTSATQFTAPTTVTAQWSKKTTSVTFHWNNGTAQSTKVDGEALTAVTSGIPTPSRTGYHWDNKWYTDTSYATEATLTFPADGNLDVYAQLLPDDHTVTYDPGVATGATIANADKTQAVKYDQTDAKAKNKSIITSTDSGWNFVNWKVDGGSKTYAGDGNATLDRITGNVKLVAQWTMDMSFNWNLPSGESTSTAAPTTQKIAKGATLNSVPSGTTLTNYTFKEWNTKQDGTGTKVVAATTFDAPGTLYAQWTPKNYTVTWNRNGGDSQTETSRSRPYGLAIVGDALPTAARQYYTFDGWYTAASGGTKIDGTEKVTGNVTYYAHWTQNNCTVTVNIKDVPVSGSATDHNFTGDVKLGSAGTYKATISNAATATITVPQSGTSYDIYLGNNDTSVNVTPDADTKTATVNFYELKVTAGTHGSASLAGTTIATGTSSSAYYLPSSSVALGATADTDYVFQSWTGDTSKVTGLTTSQAANTVTTQAKAAALTANFNKVAFTVKLTLNLDDKAKTALDASGGDITALTVVRTGGTADSATHTLTYNATDSKWVVSGLKTGTTYKITVRTRTGTYDAITDMTTDKNDYAINLYSLDVAAGTYGNATNKPYLNSASVTRAVVPKGTSVPLTAHPDNSGWTVTGWVEQGKAAAPAKMTVSTTAATFNSDYDAATAGTGVTLTPTYTFSVPVELHYTTATSPLVAGQTVTATGATVANKGSTNTGAFVISGMTPGTKYRVAVNGYSSELELDSTMASTTTAQKVVLHKITAAVDPTLAGGTPKVNSTAGATGIYVPNKAAIPGTGATAVTVTVDAAPGAGYRWRNVTGETLWAVTTGTATITTNTAVSTTITRPSVEGDIALTAYAVRQYDATVSVAPTTGGTATFTDEESVGTTVAADGKTATVDSGTWVKAKYVPSVGNTLKGWTVTNGDLYSSSTINASNKITNPATHTGTEVYFVPTADGAKLTANTESALYEVEVAVNLDNGAYTGRKVELRQSGTVKYTLTDTDNDGVYTANVLPGDYDIYVDGVTDNTLADTAKNLNFSANDAEGKDADGNALTDDDDLTAAQAKLKQEINYYTVKLAVSPANASPVNNQVAFASSVANVPSTATGAASVIVLATASTQNISIAAKAYDDGATTHYRFDEWEITQPSGLGTLGHTPTQAAETYTLPDETTLKAKTSGNFNITSDKQITLTASFVQQFKVTVKLASGLNANEVSYLLKEEGETNWAAGKTILVDKDKNVVIYGAFGNSSSTAVENATRRLSEWTIEGDAATNYGTFDNSTHANTPKPPNGKVGYVIQNGTYTPARDSVLVLNSWQMASLTAGWTYDKGTGAGTSPTGAAERRSTWTANDGQEPTKVAMTPVGGTAVDLTGTSYYTKTGVYYTIDDDYLKTAAVPVGNYTLDLTYMLGTKVDFGDGDVDHPNSVTKTASGSFLVLSNKLKLTEVNVKVEDGATTAQPGDNVIYESHQAADIFPYRLEFTWYYADTYPTQQVYTNVAAAQAAVNALSGKQLVPDPANVHPFTVGSGGTNIIAKGQSDVTDAMKGKYIFAIVTIDTDSDRAEGTVITNAIPVDYDATITVKKDTAAITADYGHYKVYLVPTTLTNPNFGGNLATQGIVEATHVAGTDAAGVFSTKNSGLVGETNYYVYVNDAENTTTHIMKADNTAITPLAHTKDVNYYSVNRVDFTQKHFEDSANVKVGEDFSTGTYAINSVTTGNNSSVADGYGVLSGVSVTAKANTWTQDYDLTWQKKAGNTIVTSGFAFATDGTDDTAEVQNSTNANGTGYANGAVTAKTFIGGRLDQNTYTITGDVKGSGQIASAVLTFKKNETTTYTFNGTVGGNGGNGAIVTFTVPRSNAPAGEITGAYTLKATAKSSSPITTLKGYSVPAGTTATITNDTATLQPLNAGTTGQAANGTKLNNRFTIFVEATELKITVKDDTSPTANTSTASNTATASTGNGDQWKKVFANYKATKGDKMTYDVTIQNNGNAELDVTLVLQKSTDGGSTWTDIYKSGTGGNTLTGTNHDTDTNKVQFTGLADTFSLALGASKTFTVTIPTDLDNDDDVTYRFKFDTADGRDGYDDTPAPKGQYDLKLTIDPVTVASVKTKHPMVGGVEDPNTFEVDVTRIKEDDAVSATDTHSYDQLKKPTKGGSAPDTTNNDLVYEWFYTTWNTEVEFKNGTLVVKGTNTPLTKLSTADGVSTDTLSYTMNATTMGKTLYLLAKGQNNATGAATTPDVINKVDPPMFLPFTGKIKVEEDDVVIATNGTGTGDDDYQVYLWDKSKGTFNPNNTTHMSQAITTTWVNPTAPGAGDGHFKADNLPSASYNATTKTKKVYEYEVWASRVKGNATLQNTGLTITVDDQEKTVDYYKVQIDNTSVTQGIYEGKLTPATGSIFLTAATLPKTQPEAATTVDNITVNDDGFVQKGNSVTFTYPDWTKDYTLTWGGSAAASTAQPGASRTTTVTYSSKTTSSVTTVLSLNTYPVVAHVTGPVGKVDSIAMKIKDTEYTFDTIGTAPNILGIGTTVPSATGIAVGNDVTFQLPKATFETKPEVADTAVTAWGYSYNGTTSAMDNTAKTFDVTVSGTNDEYTVMLQGDGLSMTVAETALPTGMNNGATKQSSQASIPDGTGAATSTTINQTIHLNYNYDDDQTVTVQVTNPTDRDIYNVTWTAGTSHNISTDDAFTPIGTLKKTDTQPTVTLKIADDQAVGSTIDYTADISFTNDNSSKSAKVTYNLTVVVDPLPFTKVTTVKSGNDLTIDEYTVTRKAIVGETTDVDITDTPAASGADTSTKLTQATDYKYQWYEGPVGGAKPTVTWNPTTGAVTLSDANVTAISGQTSSTLAEANIPQGKAVYLVIYAQNGKNASEAAISDPITSTFQGVVEISVDGAPQTTDPGTSGTPATPVYTVNFVNGSTKIAGAWNNAAEGYVAALDPTKTYTVEVSRAKDDKTHLVTLASVTIDNDNRTATAPYFTVNAVNFTNVPYQTGTGEDFTGVTITPKFTIGADKAALADTTPVLSGQTVAAKAPDLGGANAGKAWTQDYTLTWQANGTGTFVAADDKTPSNVTADNAVKDAGAYSQTVSAKTFIGGRLDQKTYTVTGSINGSGTVKDVTMKGGHGDQLYSLGTAGISHVGTPGITANNTWTDADNNTKQNKGDKYTFTVVKGTYTVTAYEGANTTIRKVTVNGADPTAGTKRNENTITGVDDNNDKFVIYLADTGAKLGVKDSDPNNEAYHVSDSTTPNNRDEKVQAYFFSGIPANNQVKLLLNNPGNVDLKLAAPAVYKVDSGTDYSDSTKLLAAVAAGTAGTVSSDTYTDANIITISNLPTAGTAVAIGAAEVAGGTLTVATNAANTADAIYVVKFASTYDDTEGNHLTGPTVYYVFDLTVDPLPIVDVEAEFQTGSTSVLQLKGYDGTNAASGLANVTVSTDGTSTATTDAVTAKLLDTTANADITYVWAVSDKNNLTAADFEINASNKIVAKVAGTATVDSATGSKTRTITAAEQGKYLYLIAYRVDGNKNASGFAVSEAMYAPVEVAIKAYQTGHATGLTDVTVTGKLGETTKTSNDGVITAPNAGGTINFTADNADNATPASATYYFVGWGVSPADAATVPTVRDLTWNYPVTKNSTVIGYYDLLPELTGASGCIIGAATIPDTARTFTYKPNDGSGNVVIMIKPDTGSKFHATGATGEDLTSARELNATAFELIAGLPNTSGTIGAQGDYRLTDSWIKDNLDGEQTYIITFYDKGKGQYSDPKTGAANVGGYAGYDRSIKFETSLGEKAVTAVVAVADQGHGNTVQVTGGTPAGAVAETSNAETLNGAVTLHAHPGNGYVFDYWEITTGTGSFADPNGDKLKEPVYRPKMMEETVTAHFKAGTLSMEDVTASIIYGTTAFEGTAPKMTATSTALGAAFTYAEATAAELAAAGITDPNVTAIPTGWLTLNTDGTFTVANKAATNVESSTTGTYTAVDNELVIYVKATETNTGATIIKKVTIDVKPATLEISNPISAAAYVSAYKTGESKTEINHGDPVKLDYFTYTNVHNKDNVAGDIVDSTSPASGTHANGVWSVAPTTFNGTGTDPTAAENEHDYKFTFTYKPDSATEKWNYIAASETLKIKAKKPPQSIQFADTITNYDDVTVKRGGASDYSAIETDGGGTTKAPEAMAYTGETYRKNEHIDYLDVEPFYEVKFKSIGKIYGATWTTDDLTGFRVKSGTSVPNYQDTNLDDTVAAPFTLELTKLTNPAGYTGNLWAGTHHAKFTVKGYIDEAKNVPITATYELTIVVDPKVIDKLTVEARPTQSTPTSVVAQSGGTNLTTTDTKGNKPIKNAHADWTVTHSEPTQVEVTVEIDPNYKYVDPLDAGNVDMTVTGKSIPDPGVTRNSDTLVTITQPIPTLMHDDVKVGTPTDTTGPRVNDTRTVTVAPGTTADDLGSYTINLGAYGADVHNVTWTIEGDDTLTTAGATLTGLPAGTFDLTKDTKRTVTLDLTGFTGELTAGKRYSLSLKAAGKANATDAEANIISTYVFTLQVSTPSSPGGPVEPACPCKVFYHVGIHGTTADPTVEDVSENGTPAAPPTVTALEGYVFKGWSLTNPANLKEGEKAELVDPKTVKAKGETMIFYAVLQVYVRPFHQHYVIGYPNGTFGPADDINRASVATIIARAVLPGFVEGADYGNPGGYSDVEGHWAESAIAYCSKFGVFEGMPDGTFQPDRPITRQELAVAVARLDGILEPGDMSFTDIDEAGDWAMGGIYTAYTKGWVNGYPDGSFKPLNNIRRDEAVKLFNAYLNRGVDAEGLSDLKEYVHSGVASNNTENGENEYMTWPDVPKDQWAYYEIIEAANDHEYRADDGGNYTVPEHWEKCWIDERWRYGDDPAGAAANAGAAVSAGFRVWFD